MYRVVESQNVKDKSSTLPSSGNSDPKDFPQPTPDHVETRSPPAQNTRDAPSTPSPPRGRQGFVGSPASSASASSPPRGLAEAYQRIVDEENLAQDDTEGFDYTEESVHQTHEIHERVMQRKRSSESPTSLRTLRKSASREPQATNGSMDDASTPHSTSPRSSLEGTTHSSLDSGLSQHAKDIRRVASAIDSDVKVFSKARTGPRHSLSAHMLHRQNASAESFHSSLSGSVHSRSSEPPVNVPRAWGRKSKPSKNWLDRIKSPSGRLTGDAAYSQKRRSPIITESESRDWDEPIDKWIQEAARKPLPPGEDPSHAHLSDQAPLKGISEVDTHSGEDTRGWDNDDFTARSLQASHSPLLKPLTPESGRIRKEELDSLEKRAVTTSRLGALTEGESPEKVLRRAKEPEVERQDPERNAKTEDDNIGQGAASQADIINPGGPMSGTQVGSLNGGNEDGDLRRQHSQQQSHDLLRRLARSSSNSPHSAGDYDAGGARAKGSLDDSEQPKRLPRMYDTPQQPVTKPGKTPTVTGGWVDTILENTPSIAVADVDKKRYLKTPLVTGAWVDTPLPVGGRGPPMPTPEMDVNATLQLDSDDRRVAASELIRKLSPRTHRPSLKSTAPALPKSALESVITAAKAEAKSAADMDSDEDASLRLGDSTIASLEGILTNENNAHPPTPPSSTDDTTEVVVTPYSRQLKRLQSLVPSLRGTRKNISSLERAVSRSNARKTNEPEECFEGGEVHDFIWPCSKCGGSAGHPGFSLISFNVHDRVTTMEVSMPKLWTWRKGGGRPRLTWLGVMILSFWTWWIAEAVACANYCHHPVSSSHLGFGFDYDAPEPPFVLEKILYRSLSVGTLFHPLYLFVRLCVQVLATAVGYLVGLGSGRNGDDLTAGYRAPPAWESGTTVTDDEYLTYD